MSAAQHVYIGTDGGATTSKIGAVWSDGTTVSTRLLQRPTNSQLGPEAIVKAWVEALAEYLEQNGLTWDQVAGVGVAIPGPQQRYGVLDRSPNLPESFAGFDVLTAYGGSLAERAGRAVPLVVGNDGNMGGVAEAQRVRGSGTATVVMLAPGSGLGCAYVDRDGLPLDGDTLAGMEAAHMPAPLHLLGTKAYPCGCGRTGAASRSTRPCRACRTCWPRGSRVPRSPARELAAAAEGAGVRAAGPRAEGRPAGGRALRLPGPRDGAARRHAGDGARPASSSSSAAG